MENDIDGLAYVQQYIKEHKGINHCHSCGKKLGVFGWREVYGRFGLKYRFCKTCYKKIVKGEESVC